MSVSVWLIELGQNTKKLPSTINKKNFFTASHQISH